MEQLVVNQIRFGDRDRFDYSVAFVNLDKDAHVRELEGLGASVAALSAGRQPWPLALRNLIAVSDLDVVHVHSPLVASVARLAVRTMARRPRLVYTEHNSWAPYARPTRWANQMTYRLDDAQIAVSKEAWRSVPSQLRGKLEVLDHGIDLDSVGGLTSGRAEARTRLRAEAEDIVVGTVANLRPEKNYPGLLESALQVVRARSDVRFVSIGSGPLLETMKARRDQLGLTPRQFDFLGRQPDAPELMAGFDVFCLASQWEGLPLAFMEARALGLPIVVTAVGGLVDHVRDCEDGLLVEPGASDALAGALLRLIGDPDLRSRLAAASRSAAHAFDARVMAGRVEQRYLGHDAPAVSQSPPDIP